MAQDIIIPFLVYFLIFIYQNPNTSAIPVRESLKKNPDLNECSGYGLLEKKIKRDIDGIMAKGVKSKYTKTLSGNLNNKYAFSKNPSPFNYSLLKGWGAGGMPFNVLYTPNIHQKKIMKSVLQKKPEKGKLGKDMPEISNLVLENVMKPSPKSPPKKHLKPRKYYSLIPQFFVSYGW